MFGIVTFQLLLGLAPHLKCSFDKLPLSVWVVHLCPVLDKKLGDGLPEWILEHDNLIDADLLEWFAVLGFDCLNLVECRKARQELPEDGVVAVEMWRAIKSDEELRAVCVSTFVRHREHTSLRVVHSCLGIGLAGELLAEKGLAASTSARWVSTLHHKAFNQAMKDSSVVVAAIGELDKVLDSGGGDVR